jgi:hypothetical protein
VSAFRCRLVKRNRAPVAQMDRATASEAVGREFDPHRARHFFRAFHAGT